MRVVPPMLPRTARTLPVGPDWTYEVKLDGYRTLAVKDGARVTLLSRNLLDATSRYPSVAQAVGRLNADRTLVDGEVVALDASGRPSFQALHHHAAHTIVYYVFDVLSLDGEELISEPLDARRPRLPRLLGASGVLLSEVLPGTPDQVERAVRALELEGVVAKRRSSRYEPGERSASWVKVKFHRRQEFVVGGIKPSAATFESLLVGYYEGRKLLFAGKVRVGLTPHARRQLAELLLPDRTAACPFANLPQSRTGHWSEGITREDMTGLRWVRPRVVVEVAFVEWTRDGVLRHPEFVGLRTDKRPADVRREDTRRRGRRRGAPP